LAQRLATIDMLCGGRLAVGLSVGWSAEEHATTGTDIATRCARMDDFVDALRTYWADDPVRHDGAFFAIPPTIIRPKPVQVPHPPLLLGLWSPAGLDRTVRQFDGWNPAGMPVAATKSLLDELNARRAADQAPLTMHHRAFARFAFAAAEQSRLFSRRSLTSLVGAS
jgi:alkanesulfonate monooxygenase SsuD/methylene tetrahydromethanopterin reductase-like flavin-dependent oxidoreductase (luciferase family)